MDVKFFPRPLLKLTLLACLLAVSGGQARAAEADKTCRLAVASDITSLDPHAQISEETLAYAHLVFDPLVRWNGKMKLEPRLAESWEQIDPVTTRFHLRRGVTFHSGNTLTARDVAWTLNRLKGSTAYKALFEPFAGSKVLDDRTIDLISARPYGLALNCAAYMFIMDSVFYSGNDPETGRPKDLINRNGPSFANIHESGTGPLRVTTREPDAAMTLEAFPQYWGPHGNVGRLIITPVKNDSARVDSLLSGDNDAIAGVPAQYFGRLKNNAGLQFESRNSNRVIAIQMNQKTSAALRDKRVREALVLGTDNASIAAGIMGGHTTPATQQIPAGMNGHNPELTLRYNPEKARQLLKEAGYEKGLELSMIAPNNRYAHDEAIAMAFVGMMAEIGVQVRLGTMPRIQYWNVFDEQKADLQMVGWRPDTEDAANYSEFLLMCPNKEAGYGQYNSGNYCNKELDALVLASQTEPDPDKRAAMLRQVERIAYDDAAFIPLHFEPYGWAAKKTLKNFRAVINPVNFSYYGDLVME